MKALVFARELSQKHRAKGKARMVGRSMLRQSQYFRRNVCLNGAQTAIKCVKLNARFPAETHLHGLTAWPEDVWFLSEHCGYFATDGITGLCDVAVTDRHGMVVAFSEGVAPGTVTHDGPELREAWVAPRRTMAERGVAVGGTISTRLP